MGENDVMRSFGWIVNTKEFSIVRDELIFMLHELGKVLLDDSTPGAKSQLARALKSLLNLFLVPPEPPLLSVFYEVSRLYASSIAH